jgi:hypothetical protein
MEKILNNSLADSFKTSLKTKYESSIYGIFITYWLIFHWNFVFTLFFVNENNILNSTGLLKNDYLVSKFFNINDIWFYVLFISPIILTYLTIWKFPKYITIPSFKREQEDDYEKIIFKLNLQKNIVSAQIEIEKEEIKKNTVVIKNVEEKQKIKDINPTIIWDEDYERFKKLDFAHAFSKIIDSVYKKHGYTNMANFEIPENILAYSHSNELIEINNESRTISLTSKGKYFVNKFLEDPNKPIPSFEDL